MPTQRQARGIRLKESPEIQISRDIIFTWKNADGETVYHNIFTGKQSLNDADVKRKKPCRYFEIDNSTPSILTGIYMFVLEDLSLLVISRVSFSQHNNILPGDKIAPVETDRIYMRKNRKCYKEFGKYNVRTSLSGEVKAHFTGDKLLLKSRTFDHHAFMLGHNDMIRFYEEDDKSVKETQKILQNFFAPIVKGVTGVIDWSNAEDLNSFLQRKPISPSDEARQKQVSILCRYVTNKIPDIEVNKKKEGVQAFAVVEKTKSKTHGAVLRMIYLNKNGGFLELRRVFFGKKAEDTVFCENDGNGKFIYIKPIEKTASWSIPLIFNDVADAGNAFIKYLYNAVMEITPSKRTLALITFVLYPAIEQMYKIGFKDAVAAALNEKATDTVADNLRYSFGAIERGSGILRAMGLNRHQLDAIAGSSNSQCSAKKDVSINTMYDNLYIENNILYNIKQLIHCENEGIARNHDYYINIANMDNKTFDTLFKLFDTIYKKYPIMQYLGSVKIKHLENLEYREVLTNVLAYVAIIGGIQAVCRISERILDVGNQVYPLNGRMYIRIYADYLYMTRNVAPQERPSLSFNSKEDIIAMYNNMLQEYLNPRYSYSINIEIDMDRWEMLKEGWRENCFADDDYSIIIPNIPEDLCKEGTTLEHCVGTYVERVYNGNISVLFIRKKSEPDVPFFTIEIGGNNMIEQIHGYKNRNLSTEPQLIPFVEKWIEEKNLIPSNYDKTR